MEMHVHFWYSDENKYCCLGSAHAKQSFSDVIDELSIITITAVKWAST